MYLPVFEEPLLSKEKHSLTNTQRKTYRQKTKIIVHKNQNQLIAYAISLRASII